MGDDGILFWLTMTPHKVLKADKKKIIIEMLE